jgi:hypothetical protein
MRKVRGCAMLPDWTILLIVLRENIFNKCSFSIKTNEPITQTKRKRTENERTIHANEANEKRKRYEISVNLNDPGSVGRLLS